MSDPTGPFACLICRKATQQSRKLDRPRCPDCGAVTVGLSDKFKAPPQSDLKAWLVIAFVIKHGFRYQTVWKEATGASGSVARGDYPTTMDEAHKFVVRFKDQAIASATPPDAGGSQGSARE